MDIIFNGPIKRYIRCGRAKSLYLYLSAWKLKLCLTAPGKPKPRFDPPKPDILDGLNYVSAAMESFKRDKFRAGTAVVPITPLTPYRQVPQNPPIIPRTPSGQVPSSQSPRYPLTLCHSNPQP